jgi:hypothetical protein
VGLGRIQRDDLAALWFEEGTRVFKPEGTYWNPGGLNICYGQAACSSAYAHFVNTGDLDGAKALARGYCIQHSSGCAFDSWLGNVAYVAGTTYVGLSQGTNGQIVVYDPHVTGFNNNTLNGYVGRETHVFIIKGTQKVGVVPASPAA